MAFLMSCSLVFAVGTEVKAETLDGPVEVKISFTDRGGNNLRDLETISISELPYTCTAPEIKGYKAGALVGNKLAFENGEDFAGTMHMVKGNTGVIVSFKAGVKSIQIMYDKVMIRLDFPDDLKVGDSYQMVATDSVEGEEMTGIVWSVADDSIAEIDSNGLLTAKAVGGTTLTAAAADGSAEPATIDITVSPADTLPDPTPTPDPEEHTHSYSSIFSNDSENHWYECECGDKKDIAPHTAGEWTVNVQPTATEDGCQYRACTVCGYVVETAVFQKTGDAPEAPKSNVSPKTGDNSTAVMMFAGIFICGGLVVTAAKKKNIL